MPPHGLCIHLIIEGQTRGVRLQFEFDVAAAWATHGMNFPSRSLIERVVDAMERGVCTQVRQSHSFLATRMRIWQILQVAFRNIFLNMSYFILPSKT
jgi:hypothetical protein